MGGHLPPDTLSRASRTQPLAGLQYGNPSNEKKTEVAETGPATVTQASGLVDEWALSWGGRRARAWGGDICVGPKEWQCPGQGGEGIRPLAPASGPRASWPGLLSFRVLDTPLHQPWLQGRSQPSLRPNATVLVFFL